MNKIKCSFTSGDVNELFSYILFVVTISNLQLNKFCKIMNLCYYYVKHCGRAVKMANCEFTGHKLNQH